ncbi:MAG: MFS transporter [Candidatus Rokubacteria bacterium]|nr:MFS transporter [Candidatus Rokubacteria bacterium]
MSQQAKSRAAALPIVAGTIGNVIEWYDFAVYAYFAPTIGALFFPSDVPNRSLLLSFGVFGVGFFMRPLGGFFFGHHGDRRGRRNALAATIILMGVSTFLIGILPPYGRIGILAPIALLLLRMAQGFSAGGEWAGVAAFLVEYARPDRRGLTGSWQQVSVGAGFLLGSAVATVLTSTMAPATLLGWGWRLPFLFGLVIAVVGLYLRLGLEDTPRFRAIEETGQIARAPIAEAFSAHRRGLLTVVGFTVSGTVGYYVFLAYFPTYVSVVLGLPMREASLINTIGLVVFIALIPLVGALSDRVGRKPLLLAHAAGCAILGYPLFLMMEATRSFGVILAAQLAGIALEALFSGPAPAAYAEIFPTRIRYTAISVPYNLAVAAFGGTAPFIATYLVATTGNHLSFTYYLVAAGVVSFLVYLTLAETYRAELR